MGRTDDIINVAGHRLSTGGMEEVLSAHQDVAECAVLGIKDELKGEVPCGFIVLKAGVNRPPGEIEKECVQLVRDKIGPVASFRLAIIVARLPKTRSGKILRGTIKKIADGEAWTMPATIEDPKVLDEIGGALKDKGVGGLGGSLTSRSVCPASRWQRTALSTQDGGEARHDAERAVNSISPSPPRRESAATPPASPDRAGRIRIRCRSKTPSRISSRWRGAPACRRRRRCNARGRGKAASAA